MDPREFEKLKVYKLQKEFDQPTGTNAPGRTKFGSYSYLLRLCSALAVFAAVAVLLVGAVSEPYAQVTALSIDQTEALLNADVHTENREVTDLRWTLYEEGTDPVQEGTMSSLNENVNLYCLNAGTDYTFRITGIMDSETIELELFAFKTPGTPTEPEPTVTTPVPSDKPAPSATAVPTPSVTPTPTPTPTVTPAPAPLLSLTLSAEPGYVISYDGSECEVIIKTDSTAAISVTASEGIKTWSEPGYLFIYPTQSGSVTVTASKNGYKSASASVQVEYVTTVTAPTPVPSTPSPKEPTYTASGYMADDNQLFLSYRITNNDIIDPSLNTVNPEPVSSSLDSTGASIDFQVNAAPGATPGTEIVYDYTPNTEGASPTSLTIEDKYIGGAITSATATIAADESATFSFVALQGSREDADSNSTAFTFEIQSVAAYMGTGDADAGINGLALSASLTSSGDGFLEYAITGSQANISQLIAINDYVFIRVKYKCYFGNAANPPAVTYDIPIIRE